MVTIGPLQSRILEIVKNEKEITITEIAKRLGYYRTNGWSNFYWSLYVLANKGFIEIEGKRNKIAKFIKDFKDKQE